MADIGLIDVDGKGFPNLALMKISAYHKSLGDRVEWRDNDMVFHDRVYMSKIFSDAYTKDIPDPVNCGEVVRGGTGYCISLVDGKEVFDKSRNTSLPDAVERMRPDYSIYPDCDFAVSMTSRGCPRGCAFCHVAAKEGRCSKKVADVEQYWQGQKKIEVMDANITACPDKRDLFSQYIETGARINFNQGLDIRLINDDDIYDINRMKIDKLHFAWDNPEDNLEGKFRQFAGQTTKNFAHGYKGMVYCLTNFADVSEEQHKEDALERVYLLRSLGFDPYIMIYNKPNAPRVLRLMQRWCNNKFVFNTCEKFEDYDEKQA